MARNILGLLEIQDKFEYCVRLSGQEFGIFRKAYEWCRMDDLWLQLTGMTLVGNNEYGNKGHGIRYPGKRRLAVRQNHQRVSKKPTPGQTTIYCLYTIWDLHFAFSVDRRSALTFVVWVRFGWLADLDASVSSVRLGHRLCENSKYRRFKGYLDLYLMADRGLQRILRDRILRTRFRAEFSHSLGT